MIWYRTPRSRRDRESGRNLTWKNDWKTLLTWGRKQASRLEKPRELKYIYIYVCVCVCVLSHSPMSKSFQPCGLHPARLLCPWDIPGKDTGLGCHFFLQGMFQTQRLNLCPLHRQMNFLPLSYLEIPRRPTPKHVIINITKVKNKQTTLEVERLKQCVT